MNSPKSNCPVVHRLEPSLLVLRRSLRILAYEFAFRRDGCERSHWGCHDVASNSNADPTFGTVTNLINHGGLLTNFTSGVTEFDTYIAGNPQHTINSLGAEWFTDFGQTGATLTFDMGSVLSLDRLALWTDEFWGAGRVAVALSLDGITYNGVGGFAPTNWPVNVTSYGADVFGFAPTSARFVQLTLSVCPQPLSSAGGGCGLGEVAFREAAGVAAVPEPMTLSLLGSGLLALAASRRRRRN
jgi:hypothetical protein